MVRGGGWDWSRSRLGPEFGVSVRGAGAPVPPLPRVAVRGFVFGRRGAEMVAGDWVWVSVMTWLGDCCRKILGRVHEVPRGTTKLMYHVPCRQTS